MRTLTANPRPLEAELIDAITAARASLDRALDVPAGKIPRTVIDGRFTDYSTLCAAAGAIPPHPWHLWPHRPANATPKKTPGTRSVAPANERHTAT